MRKRVVLNDQGVYVDCIVEDGRISFEFEKGLESLNDKVRLVKKGDYTECFLELKKFLIISKDEIKKIKSVTSSELRILSAIGNRIDYLLKNSEIKDIDITNEFINIINSLLSLPKKWDNTQRHKTELHTHFSEILNPSEFIDFLNNYNILYPVDENGNLEFRKEKIVEYLSYDQIVKRGYKEKLIKALRLDLNRQSTFDDLENVVNYNRKNLLQMITKNYKDEIINRSDFNKNEYDLLNQEIEEIDKKMSDEEVRKLGKSKKERGKYREKLNEKRNELLSKRNDLISNYLYDDLLNRSLRKLDHEKIEYSEISFSNHHRLEYFSKKYENDNRFNFLYGFDREDDIETFKEKRKHLEELLNTKKIIGVDVFGVEKELKGIEYATFKEKLAWILPTLHIHKESVLRVHASEFVDASDNILNTLKIIEELTDEYNKDCINLFGRSWGSVPPPRIRIGHGVNIKKNDELVRLLKKFDAVVEINISSNYALSHIKSLDDVPLDFYNENGIKYVISTDGGGVYSTSIHQEENLIRRKIDFGATKKTEEEQIKLNGSGSASEEDLDLYKKIISKKEKEFNPTKYNSYLEALEAEHGLNPSKTDNELVSEEISSLSRYLMDNDTDVDIDYFRSMIELIENLNQKNSDYSKIFLYLFEKELFPQRETVFKTVEYIDNIKNNELYDNIEKNLVKIYNIIENEYIYENNIIKNNDFRDIKRH